MDVQPAGSLVINALVEACRQHIGERSGEYHYMVRIANLAS